MWWIESGHSRGEQIDAAHPPPWAALVSGAPWGGSDDPPCCPARGACGPSLSAEAGRGQGRKPWPQCPQAHVTAVLGDTVRRARSLPAAASPSDPPPSWLHVARVSGAVYTTSPAGWLGTGAHSCSAPMTVATAEDALPWPPWAQGTGSGRGVHAALLALQAKDSALSHREGPPHAHCPPRTPDCPPPTH